MSSNGPSVGARIRQARERAGMSRRVLGGLVNRSAEWVKAVETGRLQTPKLQMLTKLAHVLDVRDLAELTGNDEAVSVSRFAPGAAHQALYDVQAALTEYRLTPDTRPVDLAHLAERLASAWKVRHSSPDHRTQLGALLPDLIRDAQRAVRAPRGEERRDARRILAGVYQLADFYVAFQPVPELVRLVADRAVTEGARPNSTPSTTTNWPPRPPTSRYSPAPPRHTRHVSSKHCSAPTAPSPSPATAQTTHPRSESPTSASRSANAPHPPPGKPPTSWSPTTASKRSWTPSSKDAPCGPRCATPWPCCWAATSAKSSTSSPPACSPPAAR